MSNNSKWSRILYIVGVIAVFIGTIDPLEGSVLIVAGSAIISLVTYLSHDPQWKKFILSFCMIAIGVAFLFYFSSLGGFGGTSTLSWWWGILILPYPAGWFITMILIIVRIFRRKRE